MGLDPTNVDTDGDGVADGDEGNLYGTDPTVVDTDGDGVSDGGELFDRRTDPLVWNDFTVGGADAAPEEGVAEEFTADEVPAVAARIPGDSAALAQESSEDLTATNGDAAALGAGNASSAPGTVTRNGVSGTSLLGPDGTYRVTENSPPIVNVPSDTSVEIVPAAAPEPVADTTVDETSEPVATDTDGDGVADSDEVDLYGTDPETWDTDGDGLSDGDELFVAWDRSARCGTRTAMASRTGASRRRPTASQSSRKRRLLWLRTMPPSPPASIVTMTASRMPTKRPSARIPPPRTVTAMATTTATR